MPRFPYSPRSRARQQGSPRGQTGTALISPSDCVILQLLERNERSATTGQESPFLRGYRCRTRRRHCPDDRSSAAPRLWAASSMMIEASLGRCTAELELRRGPDRRDHVQLPFFAGYGRRPAQIHHPVRHQLRRVDGRTGRAVRRERRTVRRRSSTGGSRRRWIGSSPCGRCSTPAGVTHPHRLSSATSAMPDMPDGQVEYYFRVAKALGGERHHPRNLRRGRRAARPHGRQARDHDRLPQPHAAHPRRRTTARSSPTASTWASISTSAITWPARTTRPFR